METDRRRRGDRRHCPSAWRAGHKKAHPQRVGVKLRVLALVMSLAALAAAGVAQHHPGQTEQGAHYAHDQSKSDGGADAF